ncbi:MAG: sigma-54-dependent Fis family transcriptional regulator [Deltaproteobacteria bacterium]|nr:sigma-54-dependent Fis family transcriptional regulator [Deltaproteobacteria bacterium]
MGNVIIIDDDEYIRDVLTDHCRRLNHQASSARTLAEGMTLIRTQPADLVFLDVRLPDGNGLDALLRIRKLPSLPEVIIITGMADNEGAELAIKSGAWDYIQKPLSKQDIILHIRRTFEYREKKQESQQPVLLKTEGVFGGSPQMKTCLEIVAQCAPSDASVLISGETGTGKELFARAIHANSRRIKGPFVVVDCAALPEHLTESTLFGHVRGAFTGAVQPSEGLIKQADGGTLFLDEVGELSLPLQKSFLRVLQERQFRPVGGTQEVRSDFRLISATNRNLARMLNESAFRQDLYQRLRTFFLPLPPLRERKEDIRELTLQYVHILCEKHGLESKGVLPEFVQLLSDYDWPGNVRELVHALERAILASGKEPVLYPIHLPDPIRIRRTHSLLAERREEIPRQSPAEGLRYADTEGDLWDPLPPLKDVRDAAVEGVERTYLKRLLEETHGNLDRATAISGLSKNRLYVLIKKLRLSRRE